MAEARKIFLKKHADYRRVYDASVRGRVPLMGWFAALRVPEGGAGAGLRVGLTVPKALGMAVDRNRIKRRMREAVRASATPELCAAAVDIILHPRREAKDCAWESLLADTARALREAARGAGDPSRRNAPRRDKAAAPRGRAKA